MKWQLFIPQIERENNVNRLWYKYSNSWSIVFQFDSKPLIIEGDGDGQVNKRSLWGCRQWENTPAQAGHAIHYKEFSDVNHLKILYSSDTINYILNIVTCDSEQNIFSKFFSFDWFYVELLIVYISYLLIRTLLK